MSQWPVMSQSLALVPILGTYRFDSFGIQFYSIKHVLY